jgi:hypothetical protein
MKRTKWYDDEFHTASVPSFAAITAQYFNTDKALDIITTDGQVFIKRIGSMGSPDDGYYEYPLQSEGGYKIAPCVTRLTSNDAAYVGLDEQNHRFVL